MNDHPPIVLSCDLCQRLVDGLTIVLIKEFAGHDLDGHRLTKTGEYAVCEYCLAKFPNLDSTHVGKRP